MLFRVEIIVVAIDCHSLVVTSLVIAASVGAVHLLHGLVIIPARCA